MARAGIFLRDLWADATVTGSGNNPNGELPVTNVSTELPGQMFQQWEGQDGGGAFEVTSGVNDQIHLNEGGPTITVTITAGFYATASDLITQIRTDLTNDSSTALNYGGSGYSGGARRFDITATGSFELENSNSTRNLLTKLLGWDATDTGLNNVHVADAQRSSTVTYVYFKMPSGSGIAPNLVAVMLESIGGTDTSLNKLYNDLTVYGATSYPGNSIAAWSAAAGLTLNASDRPSESENTLQVAVTSNATTYEHWLVAWVHVDDKTYHRIGIARAMAAISSSTRTVREISDQDLFVRTPARTLENQHPVQLKSEWRISIELERWEAADYRAWMVESKRYGRASGMVFSLNWTDVLSGTLQADDEADKGFLFYGTIRQFSSDAYSGNESDYMSGQMSLGQLRP